MIEINKIIFNTICFKFLSINFFKRIHQCHIPFQLCRYRYFIKLNETKNQQLNWVWKAPEISISIKNHSLPINIIFITLKKSMSAYFWSFTPFKCKKTTKRHILKRKAMCAGEAFAPSAPKCINKFLNLLQIYFILFEYAISQWYN